MRIHYPQKMGKTYKNSLPIATSSPTRATSSPAGATSAPATSRPTSDAWTAPLAVTAPPTTHAAPP